MLSKIVLIGEVNKEKLEKVCDKLNSLKSKPYGVTELIWQINRESEAISYCNNRLLWLGWKLEEAGFKVKWSEC